MSQSSAAVLNMSKEEILLKLLKKEEGYYRVVLELTRSEADRLKIEAPFDEIHQIMKKKKILLSCIEEIDNALDPIKKHWEANKSSSQNESSNVKYQLKVLSDLVKDIITLDTNNQQLFQTYLSKRKNPKGLDT